MPKSPRPQLPDSAVPYPEVPLAQTGIAGLDEILEGVLPHNRLYLIDGSPGTGKTTLALQFLLTGVAQGERGLYVTLSESREELTEVATSHGWSLDGLEICELPVETAAAEGDEQEPYTIFHPSEVELQHAVDALFAAVERC